MNLTTPLASPTPVATPSPTIRRGPRRRDILGLLWVHGSLHIATFRKQVLISNWVAPHPVNTLEEFESTLEQALALLKFSGSEVFLVLEHEKFVHQTEHAPAFSESAARAYLRGRVQRFEQEREPMLWVSQRTASARQESAYLIHLLPSAFYAQLNSMLRNRQLDLTRILPLTVPLQVTLEKLGAPVGQPVLLVAQSGAATTVLVGQAGQPLYFSRTMQASWTTDPTRIAVEVNRSLLYAKQQFGLIINQLWLLGHDLDHASTEVQSRCGNNKAVVIQPAEPLDWLQAVAKLSPHQPVNLVAGYLSRKRRLQFLRRIVLAACWLGLALGSLDTWSRIQNWQAEHQRLQGLHTNQDTLLAERDRLVERNATADQQREFIKLATEGKFAPVPARLLAFLGSSLPAEISLTDLNVKWDDVTLTWTMRIEGIIAADEESARELLVSWQKLITRSPLRARFNDGARAMVPVPVLGDGLPPSQRFSMDGGLF